MLVFLKLDIDSWHLLAITISCEKGGRGLVLTTKHKWGQMELFLVELKKGTKGLNINH